MNRQEFAKEAGLQAAFLLTLIATSVSANESKPESTGISVSTDKPHIIFLMADDMGYGDPQCYNENSAVPTPGMNQLAKEGIRFTDAHSPSAVCTPTRYSVLTGRYCWRSRLKRGVLNHYNAMLIEKHRETVGGLLKKAGYRTACVGKWHLGLGDKRPDFSKDLLPRTPLDVGFDYFYGSAGTPWNSIPPFGDKPQSANMQLSCHWIEQNKVLRDMEVDHRKIYKIIRDKAVDVIATHAKDHPDKPLFFYLPLSAPHIPWVASYETKGKTPSVRCDMVMDVDLTVQAVMKALADNGMAEDTLLIVTSDNGAVTKWEKSDVHKPNGDFKGAKTMIYEGGHRVPFIARWPGKIAAGTTNDEVVCLVDFMVTAAAITGLKIPEDAGEDSYDISPALFGQKLDQPIREATVLHSFSGTFAIRKGDWKLIEYKSKGRFVLYNLKDDPQEKTDVRKDHPGIVKNLAALLNQYRDNPSSLPAPKPGK